MKINRNIHVGLSYTLRSQGHEGEVVETTEEGKPLEFICGAGLMLPKFEEALLGLEEGADFKIEIPHMEGYGPVHADRLVDLPKTVFEKDGVFDAEMVTEGSILPMMDSNGGRLDGKVLAVTDTDVKMDFNHPMAGQDLYFTGKILTTREATDEELTQLAEMQAGAAAGGCGDGCGSCDSDCGSDDCGCESEEKSCNC